MLSIFDYLTNLKRREFIGVRLLEVSGEPRIGHQIALERFFPVATWTSDNRTHLYCRCKQLPSAVIVFCHSCVLLLMKRLIPSRAEHLVAPRQVSVVHAIRAPGKLLIGLLRRLGDSDGLNELRRPYTLTTLTALLFRIVRYVSSCQV